jgi:hypothetical protein
MQTNDGFEVSCAMRVGSGDDHYTTLGAEAGATQGEIERLYKRLAREHHPDRGGDEERMKAINEAYRVLGNADERRAYDAGREAQAPSREPYAYTPHRSPSAHADALGGRILGAWLCVMSGLVLLFLVTFHYVMFLWPLALLGVGVVLLGVMMAHGALAFARESSRPGSLFRRFVPAQELAFWALVFAGGYGVYLVLRAV